MVVVIHSSEMKVWGLEECKYRIPGLLGCGLILMVQLRLGVFFTNFLVGTCLY